jgi:pyruvate/2-oxoacid:ferredoxin oxidoreductase beta subunit
MEILTKLDRVWESSHCPGCGSILGLKFVLQTLDKLDNVILVTSPGEISFLAKAGLRVNVVNSRNPAATARGLAIAQPDKVIVVYAGDGFTDMTLSSVLEVKENVLYICYNNFGYSLLNKFLIRDFAPRIAGKAGYVATASVAYYEDLIAKLKKALPMTGLRFIDLMAPCPALWKYEPSNTIEIGRMATESTLWPLYEITERGVAVTKVPAKVETLQRFLDAIHLKLPEHDMQKEQDRLNRRWRALNEGKII